MIHWFDGTGLLELRIYLDGARYATPPGVDATPRVDELRSQAFYARQLDSLDPGAVYKVLIEYGAWSSDELSDHDENLSRILWVACGDVRESPETYAMEGER